jgi:hypothetical protein
MLRTVIFIPISRADNLGRLFTSLEFLVCDKEDTALIVYVDGDSHLFNTVLPYVDDTKFQDHKCIQRPGNHGNAPIALVERRKRITDIKNESKALIPKCMHVFCIEDDTIVPTNALQKLLDDYAQHPKAGFIEAVELGRWGVPYIGGWRVDDVVTPTRIESVMPGEGVEEVDAGGFYCYLTTYDNYRLHDYASFDSNALGPDVNFGIYLRQKGFQNYIDWDVNCDHLTRNGNRLHPRTTQPRKVAMEKHGERWQQSIS